MFSSRNPLTHRFFTPRCNPLWLTGLKSPTSQLTIPLRYISDAVAKAEYKVGPLLFSGSTRQGRSLEAMGRPRNAHGMPWRTLCIAGWSSAAGCGRGSIACSLLITSPEKHSLGFTTSGLRTLGPVHQLHYFFIFFFFYEYYSLLPACMRMDVHS